MPQVTALRNVELVRAGTWDAQTGRATITPADLADVVAASIDPEVDQAPVKIGHTGAWAALGDSAPALGWATNVTAGDGTAARPNRAAVYGDLVDVPVGLAAILPKAFRRRSVELSRGKGGAGVTTPSGRRYRMTLAGVALLGVQPPAVKGLADVAALYNADARPIAAGDRLDDDDVVALDVVEGDADAAGRDLIAASATALAGAVTAGDATPEAANAILDRLFAAAGVSDATIPPAETGDGDTGADDTASATGGLPMPVDDARLRELLGIEADADVEATITDLRTRAQAAASADASADAGAAGSTAAGTSTSTSTTPPATATAAPAAPASAVERIAAAGATIAEDGTVRLSAGTLAAILDDAAAGTAALSRLDEQARTAALDAAVRAGRIAPAEREHFAASYAARPVDELTTFLAGLAPRFAVVELGADDADETGNDAALDAFLADTFGDELAAR